MPTTSQIIELAKLQLTDWANDGAKGIVVGLDQVNRKMMAKDVDHTIYVDPSTGDLPYLVTQDGVRQYTMASNIRKIADILIPVSTGYEGSGTYGPYEEVVYRGRNYWRPFATCRPRVNSTTLATITFLDDPGDTTERYQYKAWLIPTQITSPNIQVDVPEDFHDLVVDGLVAWGRKQQYGEDAAWLAWLNRLPMEFWSELNDNPPKPHYGQRRFC